MSRRRPLHDSPSISSFAVENPVSHCLRAASSLLVIAFSVGCHGIPNTPTPTSLNVSYLVPATGLTIRETPVSINGTGFKSGATVTFGGVALAVTAVSSSAITVVAPPHAAETLDVVVTNPDGQSARKAAGFAYVSPGSFDFNGEWSAFLGNGDDGTFAFTI